MTGTLAGVHAGVALLAALRHRERTGEGQLVEVAQIEVGAAVTAEPVIEFSLRGVIAPREGNRHRAYAQGVYSTSGEDDWLALSVRDDSDWAAMTSAMKADELRDDARFSTATARLENHDAFDDVVARWTSTMTAEDAAEVLTAHGVPAQRVMTADRMYEIPQLDARGYYQEVEHPITGALRYPGWPVRISPGPPAHHRLPPPTLGQHIAEILARLGLSTDDVAELQADRIIGQRIPIG